METITGCILDLCAYPEAIEPLRSEIIEVIGSSGWAKTSLYKLKLMDSFMKECQRLHFMGFTSLHRHVDKDVVLSDGTLLRKGTRVTCSGDPFLDPNVYPDPEKFDIYRFYNLRNRPGEENSYQYVTTTPQHLLFGHGMHACPGRSFASNEMKIVLCHLLLKYDWELCEGENVQPPRLQIDSGYLMNPAAKVMMRRRKEEIDLDTLSEDPSK